MKTWTIESKAGVIYGQYEGETSHEAFLAMIRDGGGSGDFPDETTGEESDWIIYEAQ